LLPLDVIFQVHRIRLRPGIFSDPAAEAHNIFLADLVAGIKGPFSKRRDGRKRKMRREGKGKVEETTGRKGREKNGKLRKGG